MAEDCYYGEVPEHYVPPDLLTLGKETFEFCLRRYGDSDPPLKLRWVRKSETDYLYAKVLDNIQKLAGKKIDILEQSYEKCEPVYGYVNSRWTGGKRSGSVFVAVETPPAMIIHVVAHEFYHGKYSPPCLLAEHIAVDEKAADDFGERVEREMSEAAHQKNMEAFRRRCRELSGK